MIPLEKAIRILPGQYFDTESGLHYNYHRYYDPSTGRYLRADPIGLDGGLNLFTYANNNPTYYFDIGGLTPEDAFRVWLNFVSDPDSLQYGVTRPKSMWDPTPVHSLPFTQQFLNRLLYQDSIGSDVGAYSNAQLACEYQREVREQLSLVGMAAGFLTGGGYSGSGGSSVSGNKPYTHSYKYHSRIRAEGLKDPVGHNYPYSFDDAILSTSPIRQSDGSLYRMAGTMNRESGYYEIAVNPSTRTIFHRSFRRSN